MSKFKIFYKAAELPPQWDELAANPFQKKDFLQFLERVNPCRQAYHLNTADRILLITYRLKLDVLSFRNGFSLRLPIEIAGVPLSIASPGYACPPQSLDALAEYMNRFKLLLILNTDGALKLAKGRTLPAYALIPQMSLDAHLAQMRSHYRYRLKKASTRGRALRFEKIEGADFDEELYGFYEEVYARSNGKLEKLSIDFFRESAVDLYRITNEQSKAVGFFQSMWQGEEYLFLFCGFDHRRNRDYDIYLNILLKLLELGASAKRIHLGQTTAYSKSIVGGEPTPLYLQLASSCLPKLLLEKIVSLLSNKADDPEIHCMKTAAL